MKTPYKYYNNLKIFTSEILLDKGRIMVGHGEFLSEQMPLKISTSYWLHAKLMNSTYPEHSHEGGKWLIFRERHELEAVWLKILEILNTDKLGIHVKSSTALINPNTNNICEGVICVYTYDCTDIVDVMTISQALRDIGITWKIPYKTDVNIGKYSKDGFRTSLFYE